MITQFRFEGGQQLADALGQLSTRVSAKVKREALKESAEPMRVRMSELAPLDPTTPLDLKDEMVISNARGQDAADTAIVVGPSRRVPYGYLQEFGTVHHGAQPFARPAFDLTNRQALTILRTALWAALTKRGFGVRRGGGSGLV